MASDFKKPDPDPNAMPTSPFAAVQRAREVSHRLMTDGMEAAQAIADEYAEAVAQNKIQPIDPSHARSAKPIISAKLEQTIRAMADALAPGAILTLAEICVDPMQHGSARAAAAGAIKDRSSLGRPKTMFSPLRDDLSKMDTEEAFEAILGGCSRGELSQEEVKTYVLILEARMKLLELDDLQEKINQLNAALFDMSNGKHGKIALN